MQIRLQESKIGQKKEFLREILKEVRVRGDTVTLTYKLPLTQRTPFSEGKKPRKKEFFTLEKLVEPKGIEPSTS